MVVKLSKDWKLRGEELHCGPEAISDVLGRAEGWYNVKSLPCDVHVPLIENGVLKDPVIADYCFDSVMIEKKSWWFVKNFDASEAIAHNCCELVCESLDAEADIFINGKHIAHQRSQTYPFRRDIRRFLRPGENILAIRVTSGLEHYNDSDAAPVARYVAGGGVTEVAEDIRGDVRRVFVRKPAYVYGWDWNPRIATCGIGEVALECYDAVAVRGARFVTERIENGVAYVEVEAEIECLSLQVTADVIVRAVISFEGVEAARAERKFLARAGLNYITFNMSIPDAKLWWPNGMGAQPLYDVRAEAKIYNTANVYEFRTGIRIVGLDMSELLGGERMFAPTINGVKVFCKGGNWETPDSLYLRITDEKYELLLREARDANFTMLRFNGVNAYERDYFYECCDKYGILIWQDITLSCGAFRDELDWFYDEVRNELEHQTRRLRNHPCIALWCGSNECQWLLEFQDFYTTGRFETPSSCGFKIYNTLIPETIHKNCPDIPYWNCSPFGGEVLNSENCGDTHHWHTGFMNADMNRRIKPEAYDEVGSKFVSEFGCIGPVRASSIMRYFDGKEIDRQSRVWKLHTNTFEKHTVNAAISKHYADSAGLPLDEYILYAGLFQGFTLAYAFEAMRITPNNHGALMWSYNDCRGEIGWSIVDYYVTRKISYYFVKRALAHKSLVIRKRGDNVSVWLLNDTLEPICVEIEYGYTGFDGSVRDTRKTAVRAEARSVAEVASFPMIGDISTGVFFASTAAEGILPVVLRSADRRTLEIPAPKLTTELLSDGCCVTFKVTSDSYAHGVHFAFPDTTRLSDEYFDLLPGESRVICAEIGRDIFEESMIKASCV